MTDSEHMQALFDHAATLFEAAIPDLEELARLLRAGEPVSAGSYMAKVTGKLKLAASQVTFAVRMREMGED